MNFAELLIEAMMLSQERKNPSKAIEDQERKGQLTILEKCRIPINVNYGIPDHIRFVGISDDMEYEERKRIADKNKI